MKKVFHHPERFLESGGLFGRSAASALGRPNLDAWELFTRETLQNSWDARDQSSTDDGVTFSIRYESLSETASAALRQFFDGGTDGLPKLERFLASPSDLDLLIVSDAGTTGLQGSTSATVSKGPNQREDFVAFVRNIGRPADKQLKGGTYGFGKGVFFSVSEVNTILVYTRTVDEFYQPVHRFIAMANSDSFDSEKHRYTGRHWWGDQAFGSSGNHYVEPFEGDDADELARLFSMDHQFSDLRPTGTSIAVLNPRMLADDKGNVGVESMLTKVAESLTRWAWPHMVQRTENLDPIEFEVLNNGVEVPIPDPNTDSRLAPFVKAYKKCLDEPEPEKRVDFKSEWVGRGLTKWVDIVGQRPIEYLGRLATVTVPSERISSKSVLDEGLTHHVALIRNPRMVVTYWSGPLAEEGTDYAGVFIASSKLDPFFAASEPTAHDEWNSKSVDLSDPKLVDQRTGKARKNNPVSVSLNRLREQLRPGATQKMDPATKASDSKVTAISNNLGSIFANAPGKGVRLRKTPPPAVPTRNPARGVRASIELLELLPSQLGTLAVFRVQVMSSEAARREGLEIRVKGSVVVDGRKISDPERGVELPKPLGWADDTQIDNPTWSHFDGLDRRSVDKGEWSAQFAFLQPPDTAISADVQVVDSSKELEQ